MGRERFLRSDYLAPQFCCSSISTVALPIAAMVLAFSKPARVVDGQVITSPVLFLHSMKPCAFTFTLWMIPKSQTDLKDHGTFFSLVVIYLMNLLLLSVMLILASRQITFESFGADLLTNLGSFVQWIIKIFAQLRVTIGV